MVRNPRAVLVRAHRVRVALAGIGDLREKREEVNRQILQQEEEKAKIQKVRLCDAWLHAHAETHPLACPDTRS